MRRTLSVLTLGLILGALLMAAVPGGAVGQTFLLGQKNTEKVVSRLNTRGGLRIDSFKSGNPPLILNTTDVNTPPMQVNSHARVAMLNADYVDGWSGGELRSSWDWCSNDNISGASYWCSQTITVPAGGGVVMMAGSVDVTAGATDTTVTCWLEVGVSAVNASNRVVDIGTGTKGMCASTGAKELSAGPYTVYFKVASTAGDTDLVEGSAWFLTLPS